MNKWSKGQYIFESIIDELRSSCTIVQCRAAVSRLIKRNASIIHVKFSFEKLQNTEFILSVDFPIFFVFDTHWIVKTDGMGSFDGFHAEFCVSSINRIISTTFYQLWLYSREYLDFGEPFWWWTWRMGACLCSW